jgi:hypothetical protein
MDQPRIGTGSLKGTIHPIESVEDTGLNFGFITDLIIKVMYFTGYITGFEVADRVKLPFPGVVDRALEFLKREKMCEVRGTGGIGEGSYQYAITSMGTAKAQEVLERSTYAGPAPVTLEDYGRVIRAQGIRQLRVGPDVMRNALSQLVLNDRTLDFIGPAVNSGKSLFLYGPPGNGKTTIGEAIGEMILGEEMMMPYAVIVDGMVIKTYDEVNHELVEKASVIPGSGTHRRFPDPRWIRVKRPSIMSGGELTLRSLDLIWNETTRFYEAPNQMKANGGMLLVDDFGRQLVRPRDLLNRWIVPLEKRVDYLTLHTGQKIEIPFEVLVIFATNMDPKDLVDEAFLRRIPHKIEAVDPTLDEFREIFRRVCGALGIPFEEEGLRYLLQEHYVKASRKLRAVHPRDIVSQLLDLAAYFGVEPCLSEELLDRAAAAYFVEL